MNKKSLILLLMLLITSNSIIPAMNSSIEESKKEDIVLNEKGSWNESDSPRSLDRLVWNCYYENGLLYLNVPFEMGFVSLTVTNMITGEVWNYRQESGWGWISLFTSEASSTYRVEVRTEFYGDYIGYYMKE